MRLLLDTHVLLWTLAGSPRINNVKALILSEESEVFVSTVSWWELATKISIGKLAADLPTLRQAVKDSGILELMVKGEHAERLVGLPLLHRDPFDRMLVAQAMAEPMRLITADAALAQYTDLVMILSAC
jgi:PIN domain nuclease of toxin-antitoxin system